MTKDEISKIKEHIEIHARRESRAIRITEIMRKAVDELERIAELEKENANLKALRKYELNVAKLEIEKLEKENEKYVKENTKAKELLKQWLQTSKAGGCDNINIVTDTEQFLKENKYDR